MNTSEHIMIGVDGKMLTLGGGSVTSVASDSRVMFDINGNETVGLTQDANGFYLSANKYDKRFASLSDAAAWLNQNGAKYVGIDSND